MILIVTSKTDITSDLVVLRLQERRAPYVRFNTEDFPAHVGITWQTHGSDASGVLALPRATLDLASIKAVWFRRPVAPIPDERITDSAARAFAISESEAVLGGLWQSIGGLWVSRPENIRRASYKLNQLRMAAQLGLEVPTSILTTDPMEAQKFCSLWPRVIAKPIASGRVQVNEATDALIYTTTLDNEALSRLDAVAFSPTLFQVQMPKRFDLRVTVIGESIYATEIHLSEGDSNQVDWRRSKLDSLTHAHHVLPPSLAEQIRTLVRHFGFQFGALDFIVTPDGNYVFLEINPNGQWGWIEQTIGTPLSSALADLLMGEAQPL